MSADPPSADPSVDPVAELLVRRLAAAGQTVACAESLTGGLVCATLVSVPGASAVVRGGVVAYAVDAKAALLGVDPDLLGRVGAVDPEVAAALARGAARVLGATWGVGTTGVAGPDPSDGMPVGTVFVAVSGPGSARRWSRSVALAGPGSRSDGPVFGPPYACSSGSAADRFGVCGAAPPARAAWTL